MTTGGFSSFGLLKEEQALVLPSLTNNDAIEIGLIAVSIGRERSLPAEAALRDLRGDPADVCRKDTPTVGLESESDQQIAKSRLAGVDRGHVVVVEIRADDDALAPNCGGATAGPDVQPGGGLRRRTGLRRGRASRARQERERGNGHEAQCCCDFE